MDAKRYQSKLRYWNRAKAFGFASYINDEGREVSVFTHITQFKGEHRIPQAGDVIEFELGTDIKSQRPLAMNVKFIELTQGQIEHEQLQK